MTVKKVAMQDAPPPAPPPPASPPPASLAPDEAIAHARDRVAAPAIALMVTAGVGLLFALVQIVATVAGFSSYGNLSEQMPGLAPYEGVMTALNYVNCAVLILLSGFLFWAALKMKRLESHTMAMAAAVVALLPCTSPCCVLGLPFGIWAMVVLMDERVKAGFALASTRHE